MLTRQEKIIFFYTFQGLICPNKGLFERQRAPFTGFDLASSVQLSYTEKQGQPLDWQRRLKQQLLST